VSKLFLCYGKVIPRDTSMKQKKFGLQHARISMDGRETLEARLLDRDSVVWLCGTTIMNMLYMLYMFLL